MRIPYYVAGTTRLALELAATFIPNQIGIGSSSLSSVPATSAGSASATTAPVSAPHNNGHSQEASSVYVSNLPTDITEEELGTPIVFMLYLHVSCA